MTILRNFNSKVGKIIYLQTEIKHSYEKEIKETSLDSLMSDCSDKSAPIIRRMPRRNNIIPYLSHPWLFYRKYNMEINVILVQCIGMDRISVLNLIDISWGDD